MAKINLSKETNILYPVITDSYANENTLDIWIKFTSHLKKDELLFLYNMENKDVISMSASDMEKYDKIKTQINVSELLKKYKNKKCTKEEHDYVYNYMKQSLKNFVKNRMTEEEQEKANSYVSLLSIETLKKYISYHNNYEELSAYDAYVLFLAKEKLYHLRNEKINEEIIEEKKERESQLVKALVKDFGFIY